MAKRARRGIPGSSARFHSERGVRDGVAALGASSRSTSVRGRGGVRPVTTGARVCRGIDEGRAIVLLATAPTVDDVSRAAAALPRLRLVRPRLEVR